MNYNKTKYGYRQSLMNYNKTKYGYSQSLMDYNKILKIIGLQEHVKEPTEGTLYPHLVLIFLQSLVNTLNI